MSEQPPTSIRVRVLDREYPLRVHPEDVGYTQHLAQLVDARLRRLREGIPNQPDLTHAIIGALEMAEELYAARAEIDRLRAQVEVEAKALIARLDAALAEGEAGGDTAGSATGDGVGSPGAPPPPFTEEQTDAAPDDTEG